MDKMIQIIRPYFLKLFLLFAFSFKMDKDSTFQNTGKFEEL